MFNLVNSLKIESHNAIQSFQSSIGNFKGKLVRYFKIASDELQQLAGKILSRISSEEKIPDNFDVHCSRNDTPEKIYIAAKRAFYSQLSRSGIQTYELISFRIRELQSESPEQENEIIKVKEALNKFNQFLQESFSEAQFSVETPELLEKFKSDSFNTSEFTSSMNKMLKASRDFYDTLPDSTKNKHKTCKFKKSLDEQREIYKFESYNRHNVKLTSYRRNLMAARKNLKTEIDKNST